MNGAGNMALQEIKRLKDALAAAKLRIKKLENGGGEEDGPDPGTGGGDDGPDPLPPSGDVLDMGEDADEIPPRELMLGTAFCRGFLSGLTGVGAVGKTAVRYLQYLSLATGKSLTGEHVHRRCRVLIVCLEDDRNEARRRLRAARKHYGVKKEDLKGWLFLWNPTGIKLMERDGKQGVALGAMDGKLRGLIQKYSIDLVGIDPFVKTHTVGENDNAAIDLVASRFAEIADDEGAAVDYIHHQRKGVGLAGDADSGRGASALRDASRLVFTLTGMTQAEASAFNIPDARRRRFVRMDSAKVNLAPAAAAIWFELIGVTLGNGTEAYPNGDVVQTVERWTPPGVFEELDTAKACAIIDEIDRGMPDGNGLYSGSAAAKSRAAWKVVVRHIPGKSEKHAREIISTWITNELLIEVDYYDEERREQAKGLRANPAKRPG